MNKDPEMRRSDHKSRLTQKRQLRFAQSLPLAKESDSHDKHVQLNAILTEQWRGYLIMNEQVRSRCLKSCLLSFQLHIWTVGGPLAFTRRFATTLISLNWIAGIPLVGATLSKAMLSRRQSELSLAQFPHATALGSPTSSISYLFPTSSFLAATSFLPPNIIHHDHKYTTNSSTLNSTQANRKSSTRWLAQSKLPVSDLLN